MSVIQRLIMRVRGFVLKPAGRLSVAAIILLFAVFALYPFAWDPPRRLTNQARLVENRVEIGGPGIARCDATELALERVAQQSRVRIRIDFTTFSADQDGPARIFTISDDPYLRNITLGQRGSHIILRLRTTQSDLNGIPEFFVTNVLEAHRRYEFELVIDNDRRDIFLDKALVDSMNLPENALANWNVSYHTALGNELTGDRPWRGQISRAEIEIDRQVIDLLSPAQLTISDTFWRRVPDWQTVFGLPPIDSEFWGDVVTNFVCFVPVGFFLAAARSKPGSVRFAVMTSALLSIAIEVSQVFFFFRYPALTDWILNTLGAAGGALILRTIDARFLAKSNQSLL